MKIGCESDGCTEQDVDLTCARVFAWGRHGKVEKPVSVEVAGRERAAKLIASLEVFLTDIGLEPDSVVREIKAAVACAGEHPDKAGSLRTEQIEILRHDEG